MNIGDRIEVTKGPSVITGFFLDIGKTGVIVGIDSIIAVRMDKFNDIQHNCGGLCELGHGRYFHPRNLKRVGCEDLYEDVVI